MRRVKGKRMSRNQKPNLQPRIACRCPASKGVSGYPICDPYIGRVIGRSRSAPRWQTDKVRCAGDRGFRLFCQHGYKHLSPVLGTRIERALKRTRYPQIFYGRCRHQNQCLTATWPGKSSVQHALVLVRNVDLFCRVLQSPTSNGLTSSGQICGFQLSSTPVNMPVSCLRSARFRNRPSSPRPCEPRAAAEVRRIRR